MDMKKPIILFCFLIFGVYQAPLQAQATIEEITSKFFSTYAEDPMAAVDYAFSTNTWITQYNQEGIASVKGRLNDLIQQVGPYVGYESIGQRNVGSSYIQKRYMVRYDRQPIRFIFVFYKTESDWKVQNFKFDDKIEEEFKD